MSSRTYIVLIFKIKNINSAVVYIVHVHMRRSQDLQQELRPINPFYYKEVIYMSGFYRMEFKLVSRQALRPNGSIGTNISLNAAAYIMADKFEQQVSSISAASYISGSKIENNTGINPDYTNKKGVLVSWITLPQNAPEKYQDPATLWNAVEKIEKAKNADLYFELIGAFEKHLTMEQKIEVAKQFSQSLADEGLAVHTAIHEGKNGNNNDHFHILMPTRGFDESGEFDKTKTKPRGYALDQNGNKIPVNDKNGQQKVDQYNRPIWKRQPTEYIRPWNDPKNNNVERWRHRFAVIENQYLSKEYQVSADSYIKQGIDKIPGKHLGKAASQIQSRLEKQINGLSPEQKQQFILRILEDVQKNYRSAYYQSSRSLRHEITTSLQKVQKYRPSNQYIRYSTLNNRTRGELIKAFAKLYLYASYQADNAEEIEAEEKKQKLLKAGADLIIIFSYGLTKSMENRLISGEYELKKEYIKQLGTEIRDLEEQIKIEGYDKDYDLLEKQLKTRNDQITQYRSTLSQTNDFSRKKRKRLSR